MSQVTLGGSQIKINGTFPNVGNEAKDFLLVNKDLKDINLQQFAGKNKILNIFPSIDTPTCATSVRQFNEKANSLKNTIILCISADLPFAQCRFCAAEGLNNVETLSTMRNSNFLSDYGVEIADGPLKGLAARAVIVISSENKILYTELVPEIKNEPNYDAVLDILK